MNKITIPVSGMHCRSCELILEKSIKNIENVAYINANEKKGLVEISYTDTKPNMKEIESVIIENGYQIGKGKKLPWITQNPNDYINTFISGVIIFLLFTFLSHSGFSFGNIGDISSPTLGVAFLVGLTAGVSSCMALIGGLVLGMSAEWNKLHSNASLKTRFSPHIYFHLGRVIGFGFLGGILGFFGSIIHFSSTFLGLMTALVGIVMLLLGLNLTNLSPRIGHFSPTLPKFFGKNIKGDGNTKSSAFMTGVLTFFLPCGFTLAMQMYAVSTGNFITGALVLSLFALGTLPGLISIGFVTAILKGEWLKKFFVFTGVIVLGLGIFNLRNGYALLSLGGETEKVIQKEDTSNLEVQEVHMTQTDGGYSPTTISIDAGKKIRWIVTGKSPYSCSSQLIAPKLGISEQIKLGENIIEFIAPKSGEIPFSCSMGMFQGKFIINSSGSGNEATSTESDSSLVTKVSTEAKRIDMTYTLSSGLSPREITVKKGETYTIVIDVKDTIPGCMSTIRIPGLDGNIQLLTGGTKVTFTITPKQSGRFPFTCAMGIPHGYINVE